MAFGDNVINLPMNAVGQIVAPVSSDCAWVEAIEAGRISTADAANIVLTSDVPATRAIIRKADIGGACTTLVAAIKYDDGVTSPTTAARIACFGRKGSDPWVRLRSKAGTEYADITPNPTKDIGDGTFKYATPNLANAAWDTTGCDEFFFGSEIALAATGTLTTATLLVKGL